jgi:hypothetical protein
MKTMELGVCSTFFLEQIHGGAAGVGCVWQKKFGVELFYWIWSCVELSQTRPKNGTQTRFWEDNIHGKTPGLKIFSLLYIILHIIHTLLANVMSTVPIYVSFGRGLTQDKLIDWPKRVTLTSNLGLQEGKDRFKWKFDGTFSLRSTYLHRLDNTAPYLLT